MNAETLKQYLLGQLREPQLLSVEEEVMTDDAVYQQALLMEDELIEAHLAHRLPPDEQEHFQQYFLVTDKRRQWLNTLRALREYAAAHRLADDDPAPWWQRLLASGFWQPLPLAATAVVVLGLAFGTMYLVREKSGSLTNNEIAGNTPTPVAPLPESPTVIKPTGNATKTIDVSPGVMRAVGTETPITQLSPEYARLEINLLLERDVAKNCRATVLKNGQIEIATIENLPLQGKVGGKYLVATIPTDKLVAGEYRVKLEAQGADGVWQQIGNYAFAVVR